MSKELYKIRDMLCDELDGMAVKGELSAGSLEAIDKLTHSIKSIDTILAMSGEGYSQRGYSRTDYNNGNSMRRDSRGRYSNDGGYSYNYSRDEKVAKLEHMMREASTEREREAISNLIDMMR